MPIKPEHAILRDKILAGIDKALRKLTEERAAKNETMVVYLDGAIRHVPAKELLERAKKS